LLRRLSIKGNRVVVGLSVVIEVVLCLGGLILYASADIPHYSIIVKILIIGKTT
jgi:hypothetical protein